MIEDVFFAWEGADGPEGPWRHLLVLEVRGTEALSAPYSFEIELVRHESAPDVGVEDLVGARAALRIATKVTPAYRLIHGVIASAEELGEVDRGTRYRVELAPPFVRATMMKKSLIYLDKTLKEIIESTLTRASWGAGLVEKSGEAREPAEDDGDFERFTPARALFTWRCLDMSRLADRRARPYCVQYNESDLAFVSRLLEEEGIAYHVEHEKGECVLVLSDFDGGRQRVSGTMGPGILGHVVENVRVGSRLRPRSASLDDHDWRKPNLSLLAQSPAGVTDFQTHEHPGRYGDARELGEKLAEKREQRLDTERTWASADARNRMLGAGSIFSLEHPNGRWSGDYLVTSVRYTLRQRGSFSTKGEEDPYTVHLSALRCGAPGEKGESRFRPERVTPRPRIQGSQTAVVTAEPSAAEAEINVGGPEDIGCVRVRFHWDIDAGRHEIEATSCWVRVSQLFAGASHGAIWNPRVGEEVIMDFLDGDPDRPIVTGRVYNGVNKPAESPVARPTWSAIKSYVSPRNDNYNMIAFEDLQGKEQIVVHAARNLDETVLATHNTGVGGDQNYGVGGNQNISVDKNRAIVVHGDETHNIDGTQKVWIGADQSIFVNGSRGVLVNSGNDLLKVPGGSHKSQAGVQHKFHSPGFSVTSLLTQFTQQIFSVKSGGASITVSDGMISLDSGGGAKLVLSGGTAYVIADKVFIDGAGGNIQCAGTIKLLASEVSALAGTIKLNG
ncbi:type VI secretion system Vgr family protein [Chondromyces apiculatus]|uniref:VgrG protein n=1 Tax=Chondromyces apiculatus DSM 436 TaxID=1192034 RepID=A0A017T0M3_9BACT|nr:type VI secretion system tip protein TssI/VgrG [Chondromyces apiculatus]EYF02071.1 VgrG protein [Chondromyces apiculatus DSM 436]